MPGVTPPARTVYDEGSLVAAGSPNFTGAGVTASYNSGTGRVDVSIPGGGSTTLPFINVKEDYGAVGDGSTDDTAAIQAALTAAVNTTGDYNTTGSDPAATVVFPPGEYRVDPLSITVGNYSNLRLVGMGRAMLRQRATYSPASTPILTITGNGGINPTEARVEIANLEFIGLTVYASAKGLRLVDLAYCDLKGIYGHSLTTGIDMYGCLVCWGHNINLAGCGQGISIAGDASVSPGNHIIFQNCVIRGCTGGGINVEGGGGVKLLGCNVEQCQTYGVRLGTANAFAGYEQRSAHVVENAWFEGNQGPGVLVAADAPFVLLRGNYHFDYAGQPTYDGVTIEASRAAATIIEQSVFDTRYSGSPVRVAVTNGSGSHQVRVQQCVLHTLTSSYTATISNSGTGLTQTDNFT